MVINGDSDARTAQQLATGAAVGAGVGGAVAAAVVPVVSAIGFTAEGIAAGSTAAAMMSSSAIASGGGVAASSSVAVLQSIGAVGLAAGPITAIVASGVALGVGTAAVVKCFRSGQEGSISVYERDHGTGEHWVIATEEGWGNVRTCRYASESEAREAFQHIWCAKILYDPEGREVESGGVSPFGLPHQTIRRVMSQR